MSVRQGLAVFVVLTAGAGAAYFVGRPDSAPQSPARTGFVNASIDLGRHFWKAEVPFNLEFANHGRVAVDIAEVKSSCDCTVIDKEELSAQSVAPGATLSIPGTLHAGTRPGEKKRTITLVTASGATFTAELHIEVAPSYTLSRDVVKFAVLDDEPVVEEVRFESDVSQMIGQPISDSPWLTAESDGDLIRLTVDPALVSPTGRSMARVSIQTNDVHVPVVTLPVAVSKLSDINVYPPRLFVIDDTPKRVLVTDATGSPLTIQRVVADSRYLSIRVDRPGELYVQALDLLAPGRTQAVQLIGDNGASYVLQVRKVGDPSGEWAGQFQHSRETEGEQE